MSEAWRSSRHSSATGSAVVDLPALVLDLDMLDRNIGEMAFHRQSAHGEPAAAFQDTQIGRHRAAARSRPRAGRVSDATLGAARALAEAAVETCTSTLAWW